MQYRATWIMSVALVVLLCAVVDGKKFYLGRREKVKYAQAQSKCPDFTIKGNLATWSTTGEFGQVQKAATSLQASGSAWVWLDDRQQEGKWKMANGYCSAYGKGGNMDCDRLPQWRSGQPASHSDFSTEGRDCAEIYYGGLNALDCSHAVRNVICEYDSPVDLSNMNFVPAVPDLSPIDGPIYEPEPSQPLKPVNNYILEFTSGKDMFLVFSVLLNALLIAVGCCAAMRGIVFANKGYSKVNMKMLDEEI